MEVRALCLNLAIEMKDQIQNVKLDQLELIARRSSSSTNTYKSTHDVAWTL